MDTTTQENWLRLHLTTGLGRAGIIKLIEAFGDVSTTLNHTTTSWKKEAGITSPRIGTPPQTDDAEFRQALQLLHNCQMRIISLWDKDYPTLLRTIHDPPALLYVRGQIPKGRSIAIVGSRRGSRDAIRFATETATTLAQHNICVISGLARGIDSAAHTGALAGGGTTVAVLGGGIDRIYPAENRKLFCHIPEHGALISEYPPGTSPHPGHFPARNRIISGLSEGVVVVEAAHNSGSLITADFALEQGRDLYAVPGSIYNHNCQGNLNLLKQGATVTTCAEDILDAFHLNCQQQQDELPPPYDLSSLNEKQKILFDLLQPTPLHLDQLAQQSGLTAMEVSAIVLHLELEGLASALPGGRYLRGFAG
ncbi:MAG: DNA protecting protein DprA [Desulfobacteraceae bacterium 4572_35.1]|nr:MAG: DNA protecting protein DprA [Desulfobacteraceae bacterium 4572_35.1]